MRSRSPQSTPPLRAQAPSRGASTQKTGSRVNVPYHGINALLEHASGNLQTILPMQMLENADMCSEACRRSFILYSAMHYIIFRNFILSFILEQGNTYEFMILNYFAVF